MRKKERKTEQTYELSDGFWSDETTMRITVLDIFFLFSCKITVQTFEGEREYSNEKISTSVRRVEKTERKYPYLRSNTHVL